ncbi:MAG: hypothetical protein JXK07_16400 [Spirochaetes bacterium]|nr:hypothetical protein [Spirochaetota bacterium]MBN2771166.1 hypothetical protein [Spirochaetota bacterium]
MQIFDGFIAAIAAEFNMEFHKSGEGSYTTVIEFENNRKKEVLVMLSWDEAEDRMIHFYSSVATFKADDGELFKYALETNATLDYGAFAIIDDSLVLREAILLEECEPKRFIKSLVYIAAKSDELVEILLEKQNS